MTLLNSFRCDLGDKLNGKSVLVTGGTGSFGHQFVRTVLERYDVRRLIVLSRDELKQYEMERKFPVSTYPAMRYFIGDVRDRERLMMAFRDVDVVIHAAALKHVPVAEYNPSECLRTNVWGAENVVWAALQNNVEAVIALSTDKAVNPINLYGASKLAAEKVFVAANNMRGHSRTRFGVVRYGNVVGSRGSVVPLYQRLLAEGTDHLPITDARMTRFWITLQQGVDFVLSSYDRLCGGEIFVPKIPSMRITDLARCMAPKLEQRIIGIRPGEKLHEAMLAEEESRTAIELADRYVINPIMSFVDRPEADTQGKPVAEGFRYTSDTNDWWLSEGELLGMLSRMMF